MENVCGSSLYLSRDHAWRHENRTANTDERVGGQRRYGYPTGQARRLIVGRKARYIRDFGGEAVLACRDGRGSTVLPRAVLPAI